MKDEGKLRKELCEIDNGRFNKLITIFSITDTCKECNFLICQLMMKC